jgi:hypothetical protein
MGQAAVDLPGSLEPAVQSPPAVKRASADDLLAQLAGEEIDRLLAEADADLPSQPAASETSAVVPDGAPPLATSPISEAASNAAQLDALFTELVTAPPATSAATPLEPAAKTPEPPTPESQALAVEAELEALTSEAPPASAVTIGSLAAANPSSAPFHGTDTPDDSSDRVPWYVRILEWMNAPLSLFPESTRELVGQVAILTLFNSLAVLLYIALFRR